MTAVLIHVCFYAMLVRALNCVSKSAHVAFQMVQWFYLWSL